jgi:hypothetical protein
MSVTNFVNPNLGAMSRGGWEVKQKNLAYILVFNAYPNIFHLYRGGQFYWLRKPDTPKMGIERSRSSI